jgi:hypothetical protein
MKFAKLVLSEALILDIFWTRAEMQPLLFSTAAHYNRVGLQISKLVLSEPLTLDSFWTRAEIQSVLFSTAAHYYSVGLQVSKFVLSEALIPDSFWTRAEMQPSCSALLLTTTALDYNIRTVTLLHYG